MKHEKIEHEKLEMTQFGVFITYRAIPFPIPEPYASDLRYAGRLNGEDTRSGNIGHIVRTEKSLRELYGVDTHRLFIRSIVPPVRHTKESESEAR